MTRLMTRPLSRVAVVAAAGAALLTLQPRHAGALAVANTEGVGCGSMPGDWNATKGALMIHMAPPEGGGPVSAIIRAINEGSTHVGLVQSSYTVLHSTMRSPPVCIDWQFRKHLCHGETKDGWPGFSRLYPEAYNLNSNLQTRYFKPSAQGAAVVDHVNASFWGEWGTSRYDSNMSILRIRKQGASNVLTYVMYQFMNLGDIHVGGAGSRGAVCSTIIAYMTNKAGQYTYAPYAYSNDQLKRSIDDGWASVYNDCRNTSGTDHGLCVRFANQVINTFAADNPSDWGDGTWKSVREDPSARPVSISPERLYGGGVHTDVRGPWAGGATGLQNLALSGPTYYSCWY